jgi:predicted HAD superfamily Cof-like phosphohydrolase
MGMQKMIDDVMDMHEKFGFRISERPTRLDDVTLIHRANCLQEEVEEFFDAVANGLLADQADALIDLVYFALGTAIMMGLPWQELWDDVHRANMAKVKGMTKRGMSEDLMKPDGWVPPKTWEILNDRISAK